MNSDYKLPIVRYGIILCWSSENFWRTIKHAFKNCEGSLEEIPDVLPKEITHAIKHMNNGKTSRENEAFVNIIYEES